MKTRGVTLAGSVIAGILASACCIGPLVFALLGISGPGEACAMPRANRVGKAMLWIAAAVVLLTTACGGCVAPVKIQLKRTEGVSAYEVSLEKAEADVTYDPAKTDPKRIVESVSKTGFEASVKEPVDSKKGR